jgi:hypothetical protein
VKTDGPHYVPPRRPGLAQEFMPCSSLRTDDNDGEKGSILECFRRHSVMLRPPIEFQ